MNPTQTRLRPWDTLRLVVAALVSSAKVDPTNSPELAKAQTLMQDVAAQFRAARAAYDRDVASAEALGLPLTPEESIHVNNLLWLLAGRAPIPLKDPPASPTLAAAGALPPLEPIPVEQPPSVPAPTDPNAAPGSLITPDKPATVGMGAQEPNIVASAPQPPEPVSVPPETAPVATPPAPGTSVAASSAQQRVEVSEPAASDSNPGVIKSAEPVASDANAAQLSDGTAVNPGDVHGSVVQPTSNVPDPVPAEPPPETAPIPATPPVVVPGVPPTAAVAEPEPSSSVPESSSSSAPEETATEPAK